MSSTDAFLTEHLTYPPIALVDDIINSINTLSFRATAAVETGLLTAPPTNLGLKSINPAGPLPEDIKHEIENGVHQLETLLESKIDKNFDKLEIYIMRNILKVPDDVKDWVRLSHYEGLDFSTISQKQTGGDNQDEGPTAESIKQQRLKLREMMKLQTLLLQEKQQNEATLASIQQLLGINSTTSPATKIEPGTENINDKDIFSFLQNKGTLKSDHPSTQLRTNTNFALSNLPSVKNILEDLQPRLEALKEANGGTEGNAKSEWRKERTAFVEKETRRHLENVRGLELGEQGGVRDGEWQGEGRKVGMEEVEALERVVGLFDDGKGTTRSEDKMDES